MLRSRRGQPIAARVLRIEPRADAVTEETLAKVVFNTLLHHGPWVSWQKSPSSCRRCLLTR